MVMASEATSDDLPHVILDLPNVKDLPKCSAVEGRGEAEEELEGGETEEEAEERERGEEEEVEAIEG